MAALGKGPSGQGKSRSGVNLGNPADRTKGKNKGVDRSKKGIQKAGGPGATSGKKTSRSRVMRESTWDRMSVGQRRNEFGTASYKKYKEGSKPSETKKFASRGID
jgi:hypothetical protein